jgi:hypothetical protein
MLRFRLLREFRRWLRLRDEEMLIRSVAIGMNSTVDMTRDLHIIVLDYDVKDLRIVIDSVEEVQRFWWLGDAEVFRTRNGHHVFFWFDHVPYGRLKMIIEYARSVDPMFKFISRFYDRKTIRVAGKYAQKDIDFVCSVPGVRSPSAEERELGSLKRQEHVLLRA